MSAPREVLDLVARFAEHSDSYRAPSYNEAQLRQEFVNPFFKALGWDVDNERGFTEAHKDVIHEDSIKIGGALLALSAVDYLYQRWRLERDLKMTPQEMREEMREMHGDPQIAARRRELRRVASVTVGQQPPAQS